MDSGNGRSIPVEKQTALVAFVTAKNTDPAKPIDYDLPLAIFHDWVDKGYMHVVDENIVIRVEQADVAVRIPRAVLRS